MAALTWDTAGTRLYETGVSKGVIYPKTGTSGAYASGVAWNGLTAVTESPSGAEANALYADNIKYLSLMSAEEFSGTIEAFTYPPEFAVCDGSLELTGHEGLYIAQQPRVGFGLCYRTELGSDDATAPHYKLHIVYGCVASPSERAYASINDSPEAITFSWEFTTIPEAVAAVGGITIKPTSLLVIDSSTVDSADLTALEELLYGTTGTPGTTASLPLPDTVITTIATSG